MIESVATIINGKEVARRIRQDIKERVTSLKTQGINPVLAMVLVGDDPASKIYINNKKKACEETGISTYQYFFDKDAPVEEVKEFLKNLSNDKEVNGILLQLPLPAKFKVEELLECIHSSKDVDGLLPVSIGLLQQGKPQFISCTPLGIIRLLKEYKVNIAGRHSVVIGRSQLVGRPVASLLTNEDSTVTVCHSRTGDLSKFVRDADIVISAIGKPKFVTADWIKEGSVVIDVGINKLENGSICGDVDFENVKKKASMITPVPGGVGPMTIAMLLENTIKASVIQKSLKV